MRFQPRRKLRLSLVNTRCACSQAWRSGVHVGGRVATLRVGAAPRRRAHRDGPVALKMGVCCFARPTTKHSIQLRAPQSRSSLPPNRPRAARIRRPSSTARCSWLISTPRASSWVATTLLTERSSRDLSTQLAFERDTRLFPCGPRLWFVHPNFGEYLMGLDENWTKLGATPRPRRGRPPKIKRGGARQHNQ